MLEEDYDDIDETKRQTRNRNEKKRRDQFNMLVNELSVMVCNGNKKVDKSSVLKTAISFLKNHNEVVERSREHDIQCEWKPAFLSNEEFTYLVLEALDGFLIVFSKGGTIYYASESVSSLLGHLPEDLVKMPFDDLVAEEDRRHMKTLMNHAIKGKNVKFHCGIKRKSLNVLDEPVYLPVLFNGYIQSNKCPSNIGPKFTMNEETNELLFVCTGRLAFPQILRDNCLMDLNRKEFTSRHSLEWKFLFVDHRAPSIIGYLPFEVLGTSGYDYYHFDDLEKIVTCHQALMQTGALTSGYYRFLTKGHQWIWLQTCFYITYHQWNSKPEFIMCTHRVVSYKDVSKKNIEESYKREERRRKKLRGKKIRVAGGNMPTYTSDAEMIPKVTQVPIATNEPAQPVTSQAFYNPFLFEFTGNNNQLELPDTTPQMNTLHNNNYEMLGATGADGQSQIYVQEQLQRKHHQLQQLIMRQQEELQKVKQELLLAKFGMTSGQENYFPDQNGGELFQVAQNNYSTN